MNQEKQTKILKRKKWPKVILWLFVILVLILVLLYFLLQLQPVQKWLVNKTTDRLTEKTGVQFDVEKVDFSIYDGLILENVLISSGEASNDTLAYIGSFSSSLEKNLLSVLENKLYLTELHLKDAYVNIVTHPDSTQSNLSYLISKLSNGNDSPKNKSNKKLELGLDKIYFENVKVVEANSLTGAFKDIRLKEGNIDINHIDIEKKEFIINELLLSEPYVKIEKNLGVEQTIAPEDSELTVVDTTASELNLKINLLEVSNGQFYFDDWTKGDLVKKDALDTKHLQLTNFNINAEATNITSPLEVRSSIKSLTLHEADGFEIKQLDVNQLVFNNKEVSLDQFVIETENSRLGEDLTFSFEELADFKKFASNIDIETDLKNSRLALTDLAYFFPEIKSSPFYRLNRNKWLRLSGNIQGTVDDMDAEDLDLSISDLVKLKGSLSTINLTNSAEALFNLRVDNINTSLANLKKIIPGFNPPERFYKLDPINFEGDIDGFFKDFVLYGTLDSPLGRVELDTRLDIKQGTENAQYSGDLALENFDLKTWTENPDFGFATFEARIEDGKGLNLDNLDTDLNAELKSFDFKGYTYSDIVLDGTFRENLFDGDFVSNDPNAKMDFSGNINIKEGAVESDFKSNIENIDLLALNLSKDFQSIHGDIDLDLAGSRSEDFVGSALVNNLSLVYKEKLFEFDSLYVNSAPDKKGNRNINVISDWINGSINGDIDIATLVPSFKSHLVHAHPQWANKLKIEKPKELIDDQKFRYKFKIKDTKDYLELANANDLSFKGVSIDGRVNTATHLYISNISIVDFLYKDMTFNNLQLNLQENEKKSDFLINLQKFEKGKTELSPIELIVEAQGDIIEMRLSTKEIIDSIESIDLKIQAYPRGDKIVGKVADGEIRMLSSTWEMNASNEIIYGDKSLEVNGFILKDGYRSIVVSDINNKGLVVDLNRFNFLLINSIIDYDKIDFAGEGNVILLKEDLFEPSMAKLKVDIPEFTLNDVDYGTLTVSVTNDSEKVFIDSLLLHRDYDDMSLLVKGDYDKKKKVVDGLIAGKGLELKTFEFIIDDGISNTGGYVDVDAVMSGGLDNIKLNGVGQATNGTTTIDYLGAELYLGNEKFIVTDKTIDLTGGTIRDRLGNVAQVTGALNHNLFTDFTSDLKMSSDNFLALDTEKFDNPSYYGQGLGEVTVDFSGPFSSTDIVVDATTKVGTVINIPVGEVYGDFDESIIHQVDRESILNPQIDTASIIEIKKLEGVDVRMNLTITQDAKINIIFDEARNDIMKGRGDGNMRVVISRQGDFNIFGDYIIEEGDYLFTYFDGFISKPFTVKKGGKITWTGDPINANIDLEANYEQLRAPVNVFLAEYLTPQAEADAKQRTDVDLRMYLTGTLYKPTVDFNIAFPELQGDLKTLADSKMRILRTNEADLNEQVAGLIMFGSFLPSSSLGNTVGSTSGLVRTGYNTLSEMISNQVSYILSGFLQEALTEDGFISGIDFELGFSKNAQFGSNINAANDNTGILPDEIEVHLKPRFKDDRWELDYGTSYVNRTASAFNNYVIHDLNIGFYITEDRRLKMRAYSKWDQNVEGQRGYKSGVGLNYRKEFGSLTDFKKELAKDLKKLKKKDAIDSN